MQRQPNEMNTENPTRDDNEISAQKLCAGMMSMDYNQTCEAGGLLHALSQQHGCAQACDATWFYTVIAVKLYTICRENAAHFRKYLQKVLKIATDLKQVPAKVLPVKIRIPLGIETEAFVLPAKGEQG